LGGKSARDRTLVRLPPDRCDSVECRDRLDRTEKNDPAERSEKAERKLPIEQMDHAEPMEPIEHAEPIEPIEQADPIDPIDSTEPLDPIERNEPSDHSDNGSVRATRPRARGGTSCSAVAGDRFGSKARDMDLAPRVMAAPSSQPLSAVGWPPASSYDHNSEEMATGLP
jgi:hypothetical protein